MVENITPRLTLSMIVKNEEETLAGCLESVKGIVDEIVIVDTGSTDKTIEIAAKYGAKIYSFKWNNDFSAARNYALSVSKGKWILYMDADERLSPGAKKKILKLLSEESKKGIKCLVISPDDNSGRTQTIRYTRLFSNENNVRFTGRVHEQIDDSLVKNGYLFVDSDIEIEHIGYNTTIEKLKQKAERNLKLLLEECGSTPHPYYIFQLANTYSILEDRDKAKQYYMSSFKSNELLQDYRTASVNWLINYHLKLQNKNEALLLAAEGLKIDKTNPTLNFLVSQIYLRSNNFIESLSYCRKALEFNKRNSSFLQVTLKDETIIYHGIEVSIAAGSQKDLFYFLKMLKEYSRNESVSNILNFIHTIINNKTITESEISSTIRFVNNENIDMVIRFIGIYSRKEDSVKIILELMEKFPENARLYSMAGQILMVLGKYTEASSILESGITLKQKDPAAYFYLISAYVQLNQLPQIPPLLEQIEVEFSNIREIIIKLKDLKNKLSTIL